MSLSELVRGSASIQAIADYLDALEASAREAEVTSLDRADQARLFEKAGDAPALTLDAFVPASVPPLVAVHHPGRNTIATLETFQRFQKRFTRPSAQADELWGYNASNAFFVKPGYFVAYETRLCERQESWRSRGGVVVDYHRVPPAGAALPEGWPRVVPSSVGLQRFVYHLTRDFMRRVSAHATIGRASREDDKGDRILDYWFTLCRQDRRDAP
ncbi:MAG: hypothetical protein K8H88_09485 [Sandaracinaceae bacterium]|nr:hypothetical protein [Sandaracinaceae bacterium]